MTSDVRRQMEDPDMWKREGCLFVVVLGNVMQRCTIQFREGAV